MNTQKGFVPILLILFGVVVIGGGVYFYTQNRVGDNKENTEISVFKEIQNKVDEVKGAVIPSKEMEFPSIISLKEGTVVESENTFTSVRYYSNYEPEIREVTTQYIAKIIPSGEDYFIEVNPGPSADYHLEFFKKENNEFVYKGSTPMGAIIPGNGFIYTGGTQNPFGSYSKFKLDNKGEIFVIKQPYQYSGLNSIAQKEFVIKNNKGEPVATIATGSPVEVILVEEDNNDFSKTKFLIKTQYNLLGWYNEGLPSCFNPEQAVIKGLCWGGD